MWQSTIKLGKSKCNFALVSTYPLILIVFNLIFEIHSAPDGYYEKPKNGKLTSNACALYQKLRLALTYRLQDDDLTHHELTINWKFSEFISKQMRMSIF